MYSLLERVEPVVAALSSVDDDLPPLTEAPAPCWVDDPAEIAAWAAAAAPGPDVITALTLLDPAGLDLYARVDLLNAIERAQAWLAWVQQRVLFELTPGQAGMAAAEGLPDGQAWRLAADEVACALRVAPRTATERLETADALLERLPVMTGLLRDGTVSYWQARVLADALRGVDADVAARLDALLAPRALNQTTAQFRTIVTRAVEALDPLSEEAAHARESSRRTVRARRRRHGMAGLWVYLPGEAAATILTAVDAWAKRTTGPGDDRTLDQRRCDALAGICAESLTSAPTSHGLRPRVQVTVALSTLLDLDDEPGEISGYGPIHAEIARRLAADHTGTWHRLVTDPATGDLLDYGTTTYRPPADLVRKVTTRDTPCVFPGCRRAALDCDLDHRDPYNGDGGGVDGGGVTSEHNMAPLCRRHHTAKTHGGWHYTRLPDGTYRWTSPTGHSYDSRPEPAHPHNDIGWNQVLAQHRPPPQQPTTTDPDPPPF